MRVLIYILAVMGFITPAMAGETVIYKDGDTVLEGYIARPKSEAPAPVVMIAHQWKGLSDYEKMRADMLAEQGYIAFALDVYGEGVRPKNDEDAAKEAGKYKGDPQVARSRMNAAYDYAKTIPGASGPIAVIGYCFGGTMAPELARSGANLAGLVSFHGGLATKAPAQTGAIKSPLQIHHGADDPFVKPEEVAIFKDEMQTAGAKMEFYAYPGAVHAFTQKEAGDDPAKGMAYNEQADRLSWGRSLEFLAKALKPAVAP